MTIMCQQSTAKQNGVKMQPTWQQFQEFALLPILTPHPNPILYHTYVRIQSFA